MRALSVLALAVLLAACSTAQRERAWSDTGWYTHYGFLHGVTVAGATIVSDWTLGDPRWGAVIGCTYWVAHEIEETRFLTVYHSGKLDSWADMIVPCLVGAGLSVHIGW